MNKLSESEIKYLEFLSSNRRHENRWNEQDNDSPILDHRALSIDDPYWREFYESVQGSPSQLNFE